MKKTRIDRMWDYLYEMCERGNSCEAWDLMIAKYHPTENEKEYLWNLFDRTFESH